MPTQEDGSAVIARTGGLRAGRIGGNPTAPSQSTAGRPRAGALELVAVAIIDARHSRTVVPRWRLAGNHSGREGKKRVGKMEKVHRDLRARKSRWTFSSSGLNVRRPVGRSCRKKRQKPATNSRDIQDFLPAGRFGGPAYHPREPVQIRDVLQAGFHGRVGRPESVFALGQDDPSGALRLPLPPGSSGRCRILPSLLLLEKSPCRLAFRLRRVEDLVPIPGL